MIFKGTCSDVPSQGSRLAPLYFTELFLYLLEGNTSAERRIELRDFDFALDLLLILTSPDDVLRLRGLQLD